MCGSSGTNSWRTLRPKQQCALASCAQRRWNTEPPTDAISDVIDFAILALEQRDRFAGQRIEIGADAPTAEEMAAALTRVVGRSFGIDQASPDDAGPGLAPLFEWLDRGAHSVDIEDVRRRYPEIRWHTFQEWARHQPWRDLRPAGSTAMGGEETGTVTRENRRSEVPFSVASGRRLALAAGWPRAGTRRFSHSTGGSRRRRLRGR
jgi:hypothetical protein